MEKEANNTVLRSCKIFCIGVFINLFIIGAYILFLKYTITLETHNTLYGAFLIGFVVFILWIHIFFGRNVGEIIAPQLRGIIMLVISIASFGIIAEVKGRIIHQKREKYLTVTGLRQSFNKYVNFKPKQKNSRAKNKGYIRNKLVVIDTNKQDFSYLFFRMPRNLRPQKSHNEVGTILKITSGETKMGKYTDQTDATQLHVKIELIDFITNTIIDSKKISGSGPPRKRRRRSSSSGSDPYDEVLEYILNLPKYKKEK